MGDAAYGDGGTRQAFADAGRRLVAKVPGRPDRKHFPKNDFHRTWRRAVAPVRLPAPSCRRESGRIAPVVSIDCRLSVRRGGMSGMSTALPVHVAGLARRVSSATGGSGAQMGIRQALRLPKFQLYLAATL